MSDEMGTTTTVPTESESQLAVAEQVKHTDGPWTFMSADTWAKCKGPRQLSSIGYVGEYVITTLEPSYEFHATDEDDANFICLAVNSHPDMLAALKKAREAIASFPRSMAYDITHLRETDAAIAKAEGRTP